MMRVVAGCGGMSGMKIPTVKSRFLSHDFVVADAKTSEMFIWGNRFEMMEDSLNIASLTFANV